MVTIQSDTFTKNVAEFFNDYFQTATLGEHGDIEIRTFKPYPSQAFFSLPSLAAAYAWELLEQSTDVYFGVNPRVGNGGSKEHVKWVVAIHVDIDFGTDGHKKPSVHQDYGSAWTAIQGFGIEPSYIIHSGGGFHCYWLLDAAKQVESDNIIAEIESVNSVFGQVLGGDSGTQDISRVLRIPHSVNLKIDPARAVEVILASGKRYSYATLFDHAKTLVPAGRKQKSEGVKPAAMSAVSAQSTTPVPAILMDNPYLSDNVRRLISGDYNWFSGDRSEVDYNIVWNLLKAGVSPLEVENIFKTHPTSGKYADHNSPDKYLTKTIENAIGNSGLTLEELCDPLFVSGSIFKNEGKYKLETFKFQTYLCLERHVRCGNDSGVLYQYDGKKYVPITEKKLNFVAQRELNKHRQLFVRKERSLLEHYIEGDPKASIDEAPLLNLIGFNNGMFDLQARTLAPFTPALFIRNILPFDYDETSTCPRFLQFLEEVFLESREVIQFVQEIVGYSFHKAMPIHSLFLLLGKGSNGKSVFLDVLAALHGNDNAAAIRLAKLGDERYIVGLMGKTINVSTESSLPKDFQADVVKQVSAGDYVSGRHAYEKTITFRPYAKHYLALNHMPNFGDDSYGMMRRLYLVKFPRIFRKGEMDPHLKQKLLNELPGIFNWALQGYQRLIDNNFVLSYTEEMSTAMKAAYYEDNDTAEFINLTLNKTNSFDDRVNYRELYARYKSLMINDRNYKYLGKQAFRSMLESHGFAVGESSQDSNKVMVRYAKLKN